MGLKTYTDASKTTNRVGAELDLSLICKLLDFYNIFQVKIFAVRKSAKLVYTARQKTTWQNIESLSTKNVFRSMEAINKVVTMYGFSGTK